MEIDNLKILKVGELFYCDKFHDIDKNAREYIVENGYDPIYGARPLKRFLSSNIETILAKKIIEGAIISGDKLILCIKNDNLDIIVNRK